MINRIIMQIISIQDQLRVDKIELKGKDKGTLNKPILKQIWMITNLP
jgi:hypothetical protein